MARFPMRHLVSFALAVAVLCAVAGPADGAIYNFANITNNGNTNVASQLYVEVLPNGSGVDFTFHNVGSIASSITDIYFDDGTLLALSTITGSSGVAFAAPAVPSNLPGANNITPAFNTTSGFSADSDTPITANGVNATVGDTEWVTIFFTLQGGQTFADTLAALSDGSLRIGLHVQGIGEDGDSDGFVNIPEPSSIVAWGLLALVGLGFGARRRRKAQQFARVA